MALTVQQEPGRTKNSPSQGRGATSFRDRPGYDPLPIQKKKERKEPPDPGAVATSGQPALFHGSALWLHACCAPSGRANWSMDPHANLSRGIQEPTPPFTQCRLPHFLRCRGVRTPTYEFGGGDTIQPVTPSIK